MEWILFAALFAGTALAIPVFAARDARRGGGRPVEEDDPHAGLLREVAGQEGPRIYPP